MTGFYKIYLMVFALPALVLHASEREKVKVQEILDCNRYLLKDGRTIQLANVETPSLSDTGRTARRVTSGILEYLNKEVKGATLRAEFVDTLEKERVWRVHLYRKYDLNKININAEFLVRGFGYYRKEPVTSASEGYFLAAQKAYERNAGVWNEKKILRPKPNKMGRRWRIHGGWAFDGDELMTDDREGFPVVTFGYRVSNLLTFMQYQHQRLSLGCGFESFFFFVNNVYLGLEYRLLQPFYVAYYYGSFLLLPLWHDESDVLAVHHSFHIGYAFPGKHLELEAGYSFTTEHEKMLRFGLNITHP